LVAPLGAATPRWWCAAFAAMLAASKAARGASAEQVAALLAL